jgi:DNA-binding FadR family transcriptional regulator
MSSGIQRHSLTDQVIDAMRARIADGRWQVGDRIPTEPELVDMLGVGRNTVREATRALSHAGLLDARQGQGTYVRATSELAAALRRRATSARMLEVLEVRRALESEAAGLAAQRRTAKDLARIDRAAAERLARWEAGDQQGLVDADLALHQAVVAAAHSPMLAELYHEITDALRSTIHHATVNRELSDADVPTIHNPVIEAIRARDVTAARAETVSYLEQHIAAQRASVEQPAGD